MFMYDDTRYLLSKLYFYFFLFSLLFLLFTTDWWIKMVVGNYTTFNACRVGIEKLSCKLSTTDIRNSAIADNRAMHLHSMQWRGWPQNAPPPHVLPRRIRCLWSAASGTPPVDRGWPLKIPPQGPHPYVIMSNLFVLGQTVYLHNCIAIPCMFTVNKDCHIRRYGEPPEKFDTLRQGQ